MLKPIDIHNTKFKTTFKGYNQEEVDAFVAKIVVEYENIYKENQRLREEKTQLEEKFKSQSNREQDIYDLLALTKETVAEAKEIANHQSATLVEEAKKEAERIKRQAKLDVEEQKQRLRELEVKERRFKEQIRQLMETFWNMLEDNNKAFSDDEPTRTYNEVAASEQEE